MEILQRSCGEMKGYAGKYLEVDLTRETIKETTFPEEILRCFLGGRGLGTKILWDRLGSTWEDVDPLGPKNILLFLPGPITGWFPGARTCVTGKSPQSNGIIGSTLSGEFPVELKCAGWDGVIVTGRASSPVYIYIHNDEVEIRDANHIWQKGAREIIRTLNKQHKEELEKKFPRQREWKEPALLYSGPAGDNKSRIASVNAKYAHGAGYGGYGGVMGSKNLKAISAKGEGPLPDVADMGKVRTLMNEVNEIRFGSDALRRWGTGAAGYRVGAKTSAEPIRNWQEEWHDEKSFGVDEFERRTWVKRYWGDFNCAVTCLKVGFVGTGPFEGAITDNPDYELQAYLGTNFGVFQPEDNVYLAYVFDDLGLCGIQGGNAVGFAAELYQRGILKEEDIGEIDLTWGNTEAFAEMGRKVAYREGLGNVLAEGTFRAALMIGQMKGLDLSEYVVHSKGVAIGAHGIRSGLDYPKIYSYPCSVQGGDHTSVAYLPLDSGRSELTRLIHDSAVWCYFNSFNVSIDLQFEYLKAVTGWDITHEEWYGSSARKSINMQRAALLLGGPDLFWTPRLDDDNPPRFYTPLPSGPYEGSTVDPSDVEKLKVEYYEALGWDEQGIPKDKELERLGLNDVTQALKRLKTR
jgi:aldehyde:ferredoxin oxidoreductase